MVNKHHCLATVSLSIYRGPPGLQLTPNQTRQNTKKRKELDNIMNEENKDKELETMRHSAAHVMAEAVLSMFPDAKFAIGPAIDDGFYYDLIYPAPDATTTCRN